MNKLIRLIQLKRRTKLKLTIDPFPIGKIQRIGAWPRSGADPAPCVVAPSLADPGGAARRPCRKLPMAFPALMARDAA